MTHCLGWMEHKHNYNLKMKGLKEVFIFAKWKQKNVTCLQQRNDEEFLFTFSKLLQWSILECQTYLLDLDDGTTISTREFG